MGRKKAAQHIGAELRKPTGKYWESLENEEISQRNPLTSRRCGYGPFPCSFVHSNSDRKLFVLMPSAKTMDDAENLEERGNPLNGDSAPPPLKMRDLDLS